MNDDTFSISQAEIRSVPSKLILFIDTQITQARPFVRLQRVLSPNRHFSQRGRIKCSIKVQLLRVSETVDFPRFEFYRLKRYNTQIDYECSQPLLFILRFPFSIGEISGKTSYDITDTVIRPFHFFTGHLLSWIDMSGCNPKVTVWLFEKLAILTILTTFLLKGLHFRLWKQLQ